MAPGTEAKPLVWLHGEIKTPTFSRSGRIDASVLLEGGHSCKCVLRARQVKRLKSGKLRKAGWRSGSVKDFLKLSDEEAALVEMRLALSRNLRERRVGGGLSQSDLAARLGSSQSRIAKMEAADSSVSLDLLIRSLLALGASKKDIARAIGR